MSIISSEERPLDYLPKIENHIAALKSFNKLKQQIFGNTIISGWQTTLKEFYNLYNNIENISKPPKVHILVTHVEEFLIKYAGNKGLGFYSEQTGETIHQKFEQVFDKYKIKNIDSEQYGLRLRRAVVEFSSTHI